MFIFRDAFLRPAWLAGCIARSAQPGQLSDVHTNLLGAAARERGEYLWPGDALSLRNRRRAPHRQIFAKTSSSSKSQPRSLLLPCLPPSQSAPMKQLPVCVWLTFITAFFNVAVEKARERSELRNRASFLPGPRKFHSRIGPPHSALRTKACVGSGAADRITGRSERASEGGKAETLTRQL